MDTVDLSNLRQLAVASQMYAAEHKGVLPGSIDELTKYVQNPEVFVRGEHKQMAEMIKELPAEQLGEWVKLNSDYEYVGKGQKLQEIGGSSAQTPLAFTKSQRQDGRTAVAFVDGHVEVMESGKLVGMLKK
jgi:prepilin-type processing-associated H-X9-DG protein